MCVNWTSFLCCFLNFLDLLIIETGSFWFSVISLNIFSYFVLVKFVLVLSSPSSAVHPHLVARFLSEIVVCLLLWPISCRQKNPTKATWREEEASFNHQCFNHQVAHFFVCVFEIHLHHRSIAPKDCVGEIHTHIHCSQALCTKAAIVCVQKTVALTLTNGYQPT